MREFHNDSIELIEKVDGRIFQCVHKNFIYQMLGALENPLIWRMIGPRVRYGLHFFFCVSTEWEEDLEIDKKPDFPDIPIVR